MAKLGDVLGEAFFGSDPLTIDAVDKLDLTTRVEDDKHDALLAELANIPDLPEIQKADIDKGQGIAALIGDLLTTIGQSGTNRGFRQSTKFSDSLLAREQLEADRDNQQSMRKFQFKEQARRDKLQGKMTASDKRAAKTVLEEQERYRRDTEERSRKQGIIDTMRQYNIERIATKNDAAVLASARAMQHAAEIADSEATRTARTASANAKLAQELTIAQQTMAQRNRELSIGLLQEAAELGVEIDLPSADENGALSDDDQIKLSRAIGVARNDPGEAEFQAMLDDQFLPNGATSPAQDIWLKYRKRGPLGVSVFDSEAAQEQIEKEYRTLDRAGSRFVKDPVRRDKIMRTWLKELNAEFDFFDQEDQKNVEEATQKRDRLRSERQGKGAGALPGGTSASDLIRKQREKNDREAWEKGKSGNTTNIPLLLGKRPI